MKISKETRTGIVITVAIALLIWGFNFLKGENLFSPKIEYYAVYQRIDGLVEANPVLVNGLKVGQVNKVSFHSDESGKVLVKFIVNQDIIKLPKDTRARIFSMDLLGSKAVELVLGTDSVYLEIGDTLKTDIEENLKDAVNKQIAPLKEKAEELLASIDSAVIIVQTILNKEARTSLTKSFESITRALESFEKTSVNLDEFIVENKGRLSDIFIKIQSVATNISNNNEQLANVINNLSAISDSIVKADFATTLVNLNHALQAFSEIMIKINNGEGSLGLLLNNQKLYNELTIAATEFNILLLDMRLNPGKYAPLKRKKRIKPLVRDSIYYKNMMLIDSIIINSK